MSVFDPTTLPWLLAPPDDLRGTLRGIMASDGAVSGATLRGLANHALDLNQATSLWRTISRCRDRIDCGNTLDQVRLAYLGSGTSDFILPALGVGGLRHGVLLDVYATPYGQAVSEVLNTDSGLATFNPQVVVIAFDHRGHGLTRPVIDQSAATGAVNAAKGQINLMVDRLTEMGTQIIVETVPQPPMAWAGHADQGMGGSIRGQIAAINDYIREIAITRGVIVLDTAAIAEQVGTARWFAPRLYYQAKATFDLDIAPLYGDHVGRLLGALRGRMRKALVLDLDNTLWGGIIGDDGIDGIKIGQGNPEGEAFLAVQTLALDLKARGIILAVCSKNEDATARIPFQELDEMALKEDDFAVFVANWTDKGTNLRNIAETLNIGVDALVFLDDNPAERARVRQVLPEVAVPELPDDPALYVVTLVNAGYFEVVALSDDDVKRSDQYRANAARVQAMDALGDMDTYYQSLDMVCDIRPFDEAGRTRTAQLINKTNQFNLTTRRKTPAEVQEIEQNADVFALQVRLTDRFGDNGMISVVTFQKEPGVWICDTWLMSCRVLGRRVEQAVLNCVAGAAKQQGVEKLIGVYVPTPRNAMVADFWSKLGFAAHDVPDQFADDQGVTAWALDVATFTPTDVPMKVVSAEVI